MSAVEEAVSTGEEPVAEVLPVLPLKETVVFPDSMTPLAIGQERSIKLVDEAVAKDSTIALVTTRESAEDDEPTSARASTRSARPPSSTR